MTMGHSLGEYSALVACGSLSFGRALEAQAREVVPEQVVGLLECAAGRGEGLRERVSHADLLRPLAGEEQSDQRGTSAGSKERVHGLRAGSSSGGATGGQNPITGR